MSSKKKLTIEYKVDSLQAPIKPHDHYIRLHAVCTTPAGAMGLLGWLGAAIGHANLRAESQATCCRQNVLLSSLDFAEV